MNRQLLILCTLAVLLSLSWSLFPSTPDRSSRNFQPPGQMFDIGGYRLHLYCKGEGLPTVVLDSGTGGFSLEWSHIQDVLARQTRVCAYDRAGYGWSDMGPLPRTSKRIVAELHRLLEKARIPGPYVMVGHSFGGYTAQYFARHYPGETAALVLIDSSHPQQIERLPEPQLVRARRQYPPSRSRHGILPIIHQNFPQEVANVAYRLMSSWKHRLTWQEEMKSFSLSAHEVLVSGPMPKIPLVVISRGQRVWPYNDYGNEMEKVWMQLQDELSLLSSNTVHLIAEKSGHAIHLDQPGLVITALRTVLNVNSPRFYMMGG